jgi:hypothetical protein
MKRLFLIAIVVALGWYGNYRYSQHQGKSMLNFAAWSQPAGSDAGSFTCDGRTHCSQMTSCEEATYFIRHCPGTKMDGDRDGIPCERQWCN